MKITTLYDDSAGELYNLTALIKQYGNELSVGKNESNIIVLGEGRTLSDDESLLLITVSRKHASITYESSGEFGEGFYFRDESRNGTEINGIPVSVKLLQDGDEILCGGPIQRYGPLIYEEIPEELKAARE